MPRFTESVSLEDHQIGTFGYAAVPVDELEAAQFTLATIAVDVSGSTRPFLGDMTAAVKASVEALQKHPMKDQMLLRVITFDTETVELHGFIPVSSIPLDQYDGSLQPGGLTALFDATISSVEATEHYSATLKSKNFLNNGIIIVITDGWNNSGRYDDDSYVPKVRESLAGAVQRETLESFASILLAVNWSNEAARNALQNFHDDAGFTQDLIGIESATPESIARIGQFIATSVSTTSLALGTGGPSQSLSF